MDMMQVKKLYERDYYLWIKEIISIFKEKGLSKRVIHTIGLEELFSAMHYYKTSIKRKFLKEFIGLISYRLCHSEDGYYDLLYKKTRSRINRLLEIDPRIWEVILDYIPEGWLSEEITKEVRSALVLENGVYDEEIAKVFLDEMTKIMVIDYHKHETFLSVLERLKLYIEYEFVENLVNILENLTLLKANTFPERQRELWEEINISRTNIELSLEYAESLKEDIDKLTEKAKRIANRELTEYVGLDVLNYSFEELLSLSFEEVRQGENIWLRQKLL